LIDRFKGYSSADDVLGREGFLKWCEDGVSRAYLIDGIFERWRLANFKRSTRDYLLLIFS